MSASSLIEISRSWPRLSGSWIVGPHQPVDALDAVVDVAERARLLAVAPDLDLDVAGQLRDGHLAADRRRRLLAAAVPGAERPEDVVEADDPVSSP